MQCPKVKTKHHLAYFDLDKNKIVQARATARYFAYQNVKQKFC